MRSMWKKRPALPVFAVVGLAVLVAPGCRGAMHGSGPVRSPSKATAGTTAPAGSPSPAVPNPFTILARYSAASLGLKQPIGLAIGARGNLYVTDGPSQTVAIISPAGKVIRRWGRGGTRPGEFSFVSADPSDPTDIRASIAVGSDGDVYVSDSGNHRVQVFSGTGAFLRQFGSFGGGSGHFVTPENLAVDSAGNVYVADIGRHTLSKFSQNGRFLWQIDGSSSTDPDLRGDFHLAVLDPHGRIMVALDPLGSGPPLSGHVLYLDGRGHKLDVFGKGEFPAGYGSCDATVDTAGNAFINSCGPMKNIKVFDRSHHLIGAWYESPFARSPRFGPHGEVFTLASDGTILKLKVAIPGA